jgi:Integrase core domain/Mu transposase, C-terminal
MYSYTINQLLRWVAEGRVERVLWVDLSGNGLFVIDIEGKTALPRFWDKTGLDLARSDGRLTVESTDPAMRFLPEDRVPLKQRERRDSAWAIIRPLISIQPDIFVSDKRGRLVCQAVDEHRTTKQTVYRLLRRYWQRGMTPNALLPDYYRSGAAGKDKPVTDKKRGRPRVYSGDLGMNIDAEARKRFMSIITLEYGRNRKLDLAKAYMELLNRYYSVSDISEETGQQRVVRLASYPSLAQFRYWFEKDNDTFDIDRTRRTPRVYDKDMRAILGTSTSEVIGPGSRYQIDATIADIYLVSRYDRNKIVGRPVLYVLVDVFSRMVVGIYAGFEGPSWVGAMMALANTAADKVEYCRQYGLDIQPHHWPCHALPEVLLSDRGETAGDGIKTLIRNFNVHVETAAPYRADWKGVVEQRFRLLQADFGPYVPGYIQTDYRERGGDDYRLDATLDIDDFTSIILLCVLTANNKRALTQYHRDRDMVADGVRPIPAELWEWGVQRRSGRLKHYPHEMVKLSLLPLDEASVTESGIRFFGCFYDCQQAREKHWYEHARQSKTWKVKISYDPRCMNTIYLHDDREHFIACSLLERSMDFHDMSLWEIDQITYINREMLATHTPTELVGEINLIDDINAKVNEAKARKAEQPATHLSKRARTANIRDNRAQEKESSRRREAFRPTPQALGKTATVLPIKGPQYADDEFELSEVTPSMRNFRRETSHDES